MSYDSLADAAVVAKTAEALTAKGYTVHIVQNKAEALDKIKTLIPQGASVMNGASVTLEQIGFVDYLKDATHGWDNVHATILDEKDAVKQLQLRKQAVLSDYYLGSVHALAESGEFIVASNSGSQLPHVVYTSPNLIFTVGTQKIVPTLADALKRVEEYVVPLEDLHMQEKYKIHTALNKEVLFRGENPRSGRKITFVLINEKLGF